MTNQIGDEASDFELLADNNKRVRLSSFRGFKVVLYFYPKDMTPGCTKQAEAFQASIGDFSNLNANVIGISKDSVKRHAKFKSKYNLSFILLSDETLTVCKDYRVWVEKNTYGRKYMGIERSKYIIDEFGKIVQVWRKVRVKGHIEEVLGALAS